MMKLATIVPPFTLNLWQDLQQILHYDFMQRAIIMGTIISIVAGLVGTFVVFRHQSFAGESLSDVAFTGALAGAVLGINPLVTLLATTVLVAIAMGSLGERVQGRDVAIGTVLAWILGVGTLLLTIFTTHGSGTGTGISGVNILFGKLLGVTSAEIRTVALVSGVALLMLFAIARPLLFASLDPDVAAARGVPVRLLGIGFLVLLAVTVSMATLAVGALLIFALLLLPAAIAQQLTTRPYIALTLAVAIAIAVTWVGIAMSFYTSYPTSVCISLLAVSSYLVTIGWGALTRLLNAPHNREHMPMR